MRQKLTLLTKTMLLLCALMAGSGSAWAEEVTIATGTFDGKNATYTSGWSTTGTGKNRNDCIIIGSGENITSPEFDLTDYSSVTISIKARRFGTLTGSKATIDASIAGSSVGTTDATGTSATTSLTDITFTPTSSMTAAVFVFTCTNATSAGSTHGAGINTITIKGTAKASSDPSSNVGFADETPSINFPANNTYSQTATTATGYTGTVTYTITANTAGATIEGSTVTVTQEGSVTVKATAPAIEGSWAKSEASYTLTVTDTRTDCGLAYETTSQTIKAGAVLDAPELTNPNNLTVTYSSSDETIATIDAEGNVTGVAVGTATITASFAGNDTYKAGSASYSIKVKEAAPDGALFWESVSGYSGSSDVSISTTSDYLDSDYWNSFTQAYAGKTGGFKLGSGNNTAELVTKGIALTGIGKLTYKVQQYDSKEAGNLTIAVTGATATGDVDVTGTSAWVEKTVYLTEATGSVVITFTTTTSGKRIRLDDILVVAAPATLTKTVTSAGWATYAPEYPVEFEDGEAYIVTSPSTTETTLVEVSSVPAGTPVVLKGAGEHTLTVAASSTDVSSNCLHVSDGVSTPSGAYVLADGDYGVGFYLWTGSSALSAGKIYMQIPTGGAREFFSLDGEANSIDTLMTNNEEMKGEVYSLSGQRVAQPAKGLYIVNGKKVIIK